MVPGSPDPGWRTARAVRLPGSILGTPSASGTPWPTRGYPWLAVWMSAEDIQTGSGMCGYVVRSCEPLERRRRRDCISKALAGEAAFCTPPAGGVLHADQVSGAGGVYPWCRCTRGTAGVCRRAYPCTPTVKAGKVCPPPWDPGTGSQRSGRDRMVPVATRTGGR